MIHIGICTDHSASMSSLRTAAKNDFDAIIQALKETAPDSRVTHMGFGT